MVPGAESKWSISDLPILMVNVTGLIIALKIQIIRMDKQIKTQLNAAYNKLTLIIMLYIVSSKRI